MCSVFEVEDKGCVKGTLDELMSRVWGSLKEVIVGNVMSLDFFIISIPLKLCW